MASEDGRLCPKCRQGKLQKLKVAFRIFEERGQPDSACDNCGAFHWDRPGQVSIPVSGTVERKEEPTFKELLDMDEKRREKRREKKKRWRRNRRLKKSMEVEKGRVQ